MSRKFIATMSDRFVGQTFGDYRLTEVLGNGELGMVYQAIHTQTQKPVAIKVLHAHLIRSQEFVQRFWAEEAMAKRLHHPALLPVYAFGQTEMRHYIVMEAVAGPTLRQTITQLQGAGQWFLLAESIQIAHQICHAVDYLRRLKARPRAIQPEKIVLKAADRGDLPCQPLLMDLGLTTLLYADPLTHRRQNPQSAPYLAPEQQTGPVSNEQTAVYGLGVLLYELLLGQLPPTDLDAAALRARYADLPEPLLKLLLRALSPAPADRFANAGVLAADLIAMLRAAKTVQTAPNGLTAVAVAAYLPQRGDKASAAEPTALRPTPAPSASPSPATPDPITPSTSVASRTPEIVIQGPDGATQRRVLTQATFTIGREPFNDIVLPDRKVSRQHARLIVEGMHCKIEDLGSSNGTSLGATPLPVNTPTPWPAGVNLRIGRYELRLAPPAKPVLPPAKEGYAAVQLPTPEIFVKPDNPQSSTLTLLNSGAREDHFDITVAGIPAAWVKTPATVHLHAGERKETTLSFQVSRSPQNLAGRYPIAISVHSVAEPEQTTVIHDTLEVAPYYLFKSELEFTKIRTGATTYVSVENQGNAPQTFDLDWKDQGGELHFEHVPMPLTVAPGEIMKVAFRATTKQRHLWGNRNSYEITVEVKSREQTDGKPAAHRATVESAPLLPKWAPWAGVAAVVASVWLWSAYLLLKIEALDADPTPLLVGQTVAFTGKIQGYVTGIDLSTGGVSLASNLACTKQPPCKFDYVTDAAISPADQGNDQYMVIVTAHGLLGGATKEFSFTIAPTLTPTPTSLPTPAIIRFEADPSIVTQGSQRELCFIYEVVGAVTGSILPEPGEIDVKQTQKCTKPPDNYEEYTLVVQNAEGQSNQITTSVKLIPAIVVASANDTVLYKGQGVNFDIVTKVPRGTQLIAKSKVVPLGNERWLMVVVEASNLLGWVQEGAVEPQPNVALTELPLPAPESYLNTPTPVPSPTPLPTDTPLPTPTPSPSPTPFSFNVPVVQTCEPASLTWFDGTLYKNSQRDPSMSGYTVVYSNTENGQRLGSAQTYTKDGLHHGYYRIEISSEQTVAETWYVWVEDTRGVQISVTASWKSTGLGGDCNHAIIDFDSR